MASTYSSFRSTVRVSSASLAAAGSTIDTSVSAFGTFALTLTAAPTRRNSILVILRLDVRTELSQKPFR